MWHLIHSNYLFRGAVAGAVAAALIDYRAFKEWSNFRDVFTYDWGTAAFRWLQGAVSGLVVAAGLGVQ